MNSYQTGREAERIAAEFLSQRGYFIQYMNWKTALCEIDIIAKKQQCLYFVEVKYRRTNWAGAGLEYITNRKLSRMRFAAEVFLHGLKWQGSYALAAVELTGTPPRVSNFLAGL
ncbi:MAG TPA: YraN family protein [Patescibacteria group bacterium]|nr:YraN family protein [Patescibacteria group bacterium]